MVVLFVTAQLAAVGQTVFGVEPNTGQMPAEVLYFQRIGDEVLAYTRNALRLRRGVEVVIEGAAASARPEAREPLATLYQTYVGKDSAKWTTGLRQYRSVRVPGVYRGVDAEWTTLNQTLVSGAIVGRSRLALSVGAGADLAAVQLRFRNLGDAPFEGPGGIWFTGGALPGVFIVTVEATQGGVSLPASLQIAGKDLLTLSAPGLDASRPAEFQVSFPNYADSFGSGIWSEKGPDGNRYQVSTARCEIQAVRYGEDGVPVWVTTVGGSECDEARAAVPLEGGLAVVGWTRSADLPVSSDAPGARLRAAQSSVFLWLERETGKLRSATYAPLEQSSSVTVQTGTANGELVAGGVTYTPSGGMITNEGGFLLRWRPAQNRFVYELSLPAALQAVAIESTGTTYYATYPVSVGGQLRVGAVSDLGMAVGKAVAAVVGKGEPGDRLFSVRMAVGPRWSVAVAAAVWNSNSGSGAQSLGYLGRFSLEDGTVSYVQGGLPGVSPSRLEVSSTGEVRVLYESGGIRPLPTTADAVLVSPCPQSGYAARYSASGTLLYGSFTPPQSFDFERPSVLPRLGCVASTAGRAPVTGVVRGEMVTLTGGNFGPATVIAAALDAAGRFPRELAGYRVRMNGLDAPMIAVARGLVAVQVPFELATVSPVEIAVTGPDAPLELLREPLVTGNAAVTLFDGGEPTFLGLPTLAALNENGSVNTRENPARLGSVVSLFGTRLRPEFGSPVTGGFHSLTEVRTATLLGAGTNCELVWIGAAPGLSTAVFQANVRLRSDWTGSGVRPMPLGLAVSDSPRFLFAPLGGAVVWVRD